MIFDTHAHYDDDAFDEDREQILAQMSEGGVGAITNVGASLQGVYASQEMAQKYDFMYAGVGIHPDHVGELNDEVMAQLYELCKKEKTVTVGEIGLDYHWDVEPHEVQQKWFIRQLQMAKDTGLPVNIHSREAAQDTFDIMKREHAGTTGGIIHCYSGSVEMAKEYVKMGYSIGIGGVVTFKNGRVLKEVVAALPMESLVLETDCPYMAPTPFRGKRNSSLLIPLIVEEIARIKEMTPQEVEAATWENAHKIYLSRRRLPLL